MMRLFVGLVLFASAVFGSPAHALDVFERGTRPVLMVGGKGYFRTVNLAASNSIPTYQGLNYSGTVDYQIGSVESSFGPFVDYEFGELKNTANDSLHIERLKNSTITVGIKTYLNNFYIAVGYARFQSKSESTGTVNRTLALNSNGVKTQAGYSFSVGKFLVLHVGAEAGYSKLMPSPSGVSADTSNIGYAGFLGLSFVVPSGGRSSAR